MELRHRMLFVLKFDGQISLNEGGGRRRRRRCRFAAAAAAPFPRRRGVLDGKGADPDLFLVLRRPEPGTLGRFSLLLLLRRIVDCNVVFAIEEAFVGDGDDDGGFFLDDHGHEVGERGSRRQLRHD